MTLNGREFSIEKGTLRLGTLVVVILAICSALIVMITYKVNMERDVKEIKDDISDIRQSISALAKERFRRSDKAEWCQYTEKKNGDFVCVDPYELPSFVARSTRGWAK